MLYWFRKWEQEINYKLFMPSEHGKYFAEILVEALLRSDIKTRTEALAIQKDRGVLSQNEWRKIENRNPVPGGDEMAPAANIMGTKSNNIIRTAHQTLLTSQWLRVIKKQNGDYTKNIELARKILNDTVIAYASTINRHDTAVEILDKLLSEIINKDSKLTEYDANRLADLTLARVGGENA
jgi:hypothetical protein